MKQAIPKKNQGIIDQVIDGQVVAVPCGIKRKKDSLFIFNETGSDIWRLIDGKRSVKTIIRILSSRYSGTVVAQETNIFLNYLQKKKFITVSPEP